MNTHSTVAVSTAAPEGLSKETCSLISLTEGRLLRIHPELDSRLTEFMEANAEMTGYYADLVKENPEVAIRAIMLGKLMRHEAHVRQGEQVAAAPIAKPSEKRQPGLLKSMTERLKKMNLTGDETTSMMMAA